MIRLRITARYQRSRITQLKREPRNYHKNVCLLTCFLTKLWGPCSSRDGRWSDTVGSEGFVEEVKNELGFQSTIPTGFGRALFVYSSRAGTALRRTYDRENEGLGQITPVLWQTNLETPRHSLLRPNASQQNHPVSLFTVCFEHLDLFAQPCERCSSGVQRYSKILDAQLLIGFLVFTSLSCPGVRGEKARRIIEPVANQTFTN